MKIYLFLAIFYFTSSVFAQNEVNVRFEIEAPAHFKNVEEIYLSGNVSQLGSWSGKGLALRRDGQMFVGEATLPRGQQVEFKATLGDWAHVETTAAGRDTANRQVTLAGDKTLRLKVENFRLGQFHAVPETASGNIDYHFDFYFPPFKNYRNIAVYVPPGYRNSDARRYPVLYSFDGNNLFDRSTSTMGAEWGVDKTLNNLISQGKVEPIIVVGIYATSYRAGEYLPKKWYGKEHFGEEYLKFVFSQIKPYIDGRYRTLADREHTLLMGSSYGANLTLFAMSFFNHDAARFIAMSPALDWKNAGIIYAAEKASPSPERLWVDTGDRERDAEGRVIPGGSTCSELVERAGKQTDNVAISIVHGGRHHESSWGSRFDQALGYTLK